MKNRLFNLASIVFVSGILFTGCNMNNKNADKSQDKVHDAKQNVVEANQALNNAIEEFKKESEEIFAANEKRIAEFKVKIAEEKLENKAILEKRLDEMEQKNIEMKKKLASYKNDGNEKWNTFKDEFNHDMKELGKAFKDLTVKNTN